MSKKSKFKSRWQDVVEKLNNEGKVTTVKIDWEAIRKERAERVEKDKIRYDDEVREENLRITHNLQCPVCTNIQKEKVNISFRNGPVVYGGRNNRSTNLAEYYVCQHCGSMYVDLKKRDIPLPYNDK
jgi:transposase-like protein